MTTPRDQLFLDLFTTALEGGINYWAGVLTYHWSKAAPGHLPEVDEDADYAGFGATIVELEETDDGTTFNVKHIVDRAVVAKGYRLATTEWRDKLNWSTEPPPLVTTADTDWDFDAGDADMIVQLGLFGDVRYG